VFLLLRAILQRAVPHFFAFWKRKAVAPCEKEWYNIKLEIK
jgi:hypothetical protein